MYRKSLKKGVLLEQTQLEENNPVTIILIVELDVSWSFSWRMLKKVDSVTTAIIDDFHIFAYERKNLNFSYCPSENGK